MSVPSSSPMLPAKPPTAVSDRNEDQDALRSAGNNHSPESFTDSVNDDAPKTTEVTPAQPPLPAEAPPLLPNEEPPQTTEDDGWEPVWDENAQAFYFYNRFSQVSQWENPRVPDATGVGSSHVADNGPPGAPSQGQRKKPGAGGYDPAIHGDYDPNADYAKAYETEDNSTTVGNATDADPAAAYRATAAFNRFTGRWQAADINPDKFSDENKSRRQMNAFFDVDAAANSHDGKSLKAERSNKKISKAELKAYREKRKEKKEERRRAWLRD